MCNDIPEVTEIQRWHPEPGDILIVRNNEVVLDLVQAAHIREVIKQRLGLPADTEILVVGRDWDVSVGKV